MSRIGQLIFHAITWSLSGIPQRLIDSSNADERQTKKNNRTFTGMVIDCRAHNPQTVCLFNHSKTVFLLLALIFLVFSLKFTWPTPNRTQGTRHKPETTTQYNINSFDPLSFSMFISVSFSIKYLTVSNGHTQKYQSDFYSQFSWNRLKSV